MARFNQRNSMSVLTICMSMALATVIVIALKYYYDKAFIPKSAKGFPMIQQDSFQANLVVTENEILSKTPLGEEDLPIRFRDLRLSTQHIKLGQDQASKNNGYFIFRCDDMRLQPCGGFADRLKGIMSAYMIANLTGRVFKAEMIMGECDWRKYIVPNQVNWSLPTSFHKTVEESDEVSIMYRVDDVEFYANVNNTRFETLPQMKSKFVYFLANRDCTSGLKSSNIYSKQLKWTKDIGYGDMKKVLYQRLFKLSPSLQSKLDHFLATNVNPRQKLICAHLRTGRSKTMPNDTDPRLNLQLLPKIWKFIQLLSIHESNNKIFIMTDNEEVVSSSKQQSFASKLISVPGIIVHVERNKVVTDKERCDGLEKTLLEQNILMRCDVLIVGMSGLSKMAAHVRGTDRSLYCVLYSGVIIPCARNQLEMIPWFL